MITIEDLSIVHYCHPSCKPLLNICRLPKDEAFALAYKMAPEMAIAKPEANSYHRFAEGPKGFEWYYPRRMLTDEYLHNLFSSLGGTPKEKHPLSFVLQGNEWLHNWFGNDLAIRIKINTIPSEFISFTLGDSMVMLLQKNGVKVNEIQHGQLTMYTKEILLSSIKQFDGTIDDYMEYITDKYKYIEVQLWNDDYCAV